METKKFIAKLRDKNGFSYAVCRKCKAKIYETTGVEKAAVYWDVVVSDNGEVEYEQIDTDGAIDYFACPTCMEKIADTEEEVVALFYYVKKVAAIKAVGE